jgi:hypothetical protein
MTSTMGGSAGPPARPLSTVVKYPNIKRFPGGASKDIMPNLQTPENPAPLLDMSKPPTIKGGGG